MSVLIPAWHGLGDNVYLRPFVKGAVEAGEDVYLQTPWPQLFSDLDVRCVRPEPRYRTQQKNVEAQPDGVWHDPPADAQLVTPRISGACGSISGGIAYSSPWAVRSDAFDLPSFLKVGLAAYPVRKAVVRPNVVRKEWENPARNPDPRYLAKAVELLKRSHFVISVADVSDGEEWIDGPLSDADHVSHQGELSVERLFALIEHADVVVGGVGFILPVAISYGTPAIIIGGGNGGHNAPERLVGYGMDGSRVRWIMPDDYCRCLAYEHDCAKDISDFEVWFVTALDGLLPELVLT